MSDQSPDEDDDELDISLRPVGEVGARLIILASVCRRAHLELSPDDVDDPEGERFDLSGWLRQEQLVGLMTLAERELIETRVGRLSPDAADAASWLIEALAVLAWASGHVSELPPYDGPAPMTGLLDSLPSPWGSTVAFRKSVTLRPETAIALAREQAEIWHWRGDLESDIRESTGRSLTELRGIVRQVSREASDAEIAQVVKGDFAVDGMPYGEMSLDRISNLTDVAQERLRALNWLCGFGASFDDAPLALP